MLETKKLSHNTVLVNNNQSFASSHLSTHNIAKES